MDLKAHVDPVILSGALIYRLVECLTAKHHDSNIIELDPTKTSFF